MNDTQIIDWLNEHLFLFSESVSGRNCMEWIDKDGFTNKTYGLDLRDCVRGAIAGEFVSVDD